MADTSDKTILEILIDVRGNGDNIDNPGVIADAGLPVNAEGGIWQRTKDIHAHLNFNKSDSDSKYDEIVTKYDSLAQLIALADAGDLDTIKALETEIARIGTVAATAAIQVVSTAHEDGTLDNVIELEAKMDEAIRIEPKMDSVIAIEAKVDTLTSEPVATQLANAQGNAESAEDDAALTAADRIATAADVVTTGNNVTAAALSETNAGDSKDAAQAAQLAVEIIYDNFDDKHLGSFDSDPTVDNDGDALEVGTTYWNSIEKEQRFWSGAVWERPEFTATEAATLATNKAADASQSQTDSEAAQGLSEDARDASKISEDAAELDKWITEALRLTTDSRANQPKDEYVIIYTSNGDGSFAQSQIEENGYSALHHKEEAEAAGGGAIYAANNLDDLDDLPTAKVNLEIDQVNNTADIDKPISIAQEDVNAEVSTGMNALTDALSSLSHASASFGYTGDILIPIDASLVEMSEYSIKLDSSDTDVLELVSGSGKFKLKRAGKYSFITTVYAKAIDKDPTITPRIVIESTNTINVGGDTIVYDDTMSAIKVKKDGIILPTSILIEVSDEMLAYSDSEHGLDYVEVGIEMGHTETVAADNQVKITGFDSTVAVQSSAFVGFAEHSQLNGRDEADSHTLGSITGLNASLASKAEKNQDVNTTTSYKDENSAQEYKMYVSDEEIVLERIV